MKLNIEKQRFIVGGASSGFGLATLKALVAEGARVIAVARGADRLKDLEAAYPEQVKGLAGDITVSETIALLLKEAEKGPLHGILINAGGPPAMPTRDTSLMDWDDAYRKLLRWKVELVQAVLPRLIEQQYGRLVFVESVSVKQPIENLVLSNSLRLAVVGFVKTLSQEIADQGITLNVLAPGYHSTPAMSRLFQKKSELEGISVENARKAFEQQIPSRKMGNPEEFGSFACWLLSPLSGYLTGQTFSVDGGLAKGTF